MSNSNDDSSPGYALAEALGDSAAPPRANGELVFETPWHSRAFGMAVGMYQAGYFEWEEFRQALIRAIGAWESAHDTDAAYDYYARWLEALESILVEKNLAEAELIGELTREIAARPPEADHHHDHEHHHH